jgi:ParB-like chromosome segregation protein Spo0J
LQGVFTALATKTKPKPEFSVENWPIDKPIDYPKNARKWTDKAVAKVAASIREFGWQQPLVVDSQGVIVIGHLRRKAGQSIGLTTCPVHVAKDLSPAKIRALRLADNRTAQESEWNLDILAAEFTELKTFDFDLTITGFDLTQVDGYLRGANFQPSTEAEQGKLDQKKPIKCPECGHEFTP